MNVVNSLRKNFSKNLGNFKTLLLVKFVKRERSMVLTCSISYCILTLRNFSKVSKNSWERSLQKFSFWREMVTHKAWIPLMIILSQFVKFTRHSNICRPTVQWMAFLWLKYSRPNLNSKILTQTSQYIQGKVQSI